MGENAIDEHLLLLEDTYLYWSGQRLCTHFESPRERHRWLHESAPFMLLAHDNSSDHCFFYANRAAQETFGYSFDEFVTLPSQWSAPPQEREERRQLIEEVEQAGISRGYSGIRVRKSGALFRIRDCVLWMLGSRDRPYAGMGALVWADREVIKQGG